MTFPCFLYNACTSVSLSHASEQLKKVIKPKRTVAFVYYAMSML